MAGPGVIPAVWTDLSELKLYSHVEALLHGAAKTGGANFFTSDITPANTPALMCVEVILETAGVFSLVLTNAAVAKVYSFNSGASLGASQIFAFDFLVDAGDTINFQTSVSGNVTLRLAEFVTGV